MIFYRPFAMIFFISEFNLESTNSIVLDLIKIKTQYICTDNFKNTIYSSYLQNRTIFGKQVFAKA